MRRFVVSIGVAFGVVLIGAGPAFAEPVPEGAAAAEATPGKQVCKVTDERLDELSGIVATDDGFIVINDSAQTNDRRRVFYLDRKCKVQDTVSFPTSPRDTEDLLLSPDGETLWIADIGDNRKERPTIGLWTMPADGSKRPVLHRLTYPDGKHDAEAMLLDGNGTPLIVTKEVGKAAGVYRPTGKLEANNTEGVPMEKVADLTVPSSTTPASGIATLGRGTIDGGSVASGGTKVVLRTYTDALEWSVANGDVVAAIKGKPRVTPLPNERQGEAITYSPDGKLFYTVTDMQGEEGDNYILSYTPVTQAAVTKAAAGAEAAADDSRSFFDGLTINDITYLVGGVGVIGAILVGFGIFGIVRARKQGPATAVARSGGDKPTDPETELLTVGGAAAGAGVYGRGAGAGPGPGQSGGGRPGGAAGGPGVYGRPGGPAQGGRPGAAQQGGGVYGGGPGGRPGPGGDGPPARGGAPGRGGAPAPSRGGAPAGGGAPARGGAPGRGGAPARGGEYGDGGPAQGGGRGRSGGEYGAPPARSGPPAGGRPGGPGSAGGQSGRGGPGPGGGQPGRGGSGSGGAQPGRGAGGDPQPGRGGPGGAQPGRGSGGGAQPGRGPGGSAQPGRGPGGAAQPGRSAAQPGRGGGGAQPGRGGGAQPGRGGAQPGRGGAGAGGAQPGRPGGGGGGQPGRPQQPGGGGVYGGQPQASAGQPRGGSQPRGGGQSPRPSGFFGQGSGNGHSDPRRADDYADSRNNQDFDAPGYR